MQKIFQIIKFNINKKETAIINQFIGIKKSFLIKKLGNLDRFIIDKVSLFAEKINDKSCKQHNQ